MTAQKVMAWFRVVAFLACAGGVTMFYVNVSKFNGASDAEWAAQKAGASDCAVQQEVHRLNEDEYDRLQHDLTIARTPYESSKALRAMDAFMQRVGR